MGGIGGLCLMVKRTFEDISQSGNMRKDARGHKNNCNQFLYNICVYVYGSVVR